MSKMLLLSLFLAGSGICAHATTLQDFQSRSPEAQGRFVSDYVSALADKQMASNPALGRAIVEYFAKAPSTGATPPGITDLMAQVVAADRLAKEGKADLSKIQVEAMIVYVVRQHFKA